MLRVMLWPVVAVVVLSVKLTVGGRSVIVLVATALLVIEPELSVAFT